MNQGDTLFLVHGGGQIRWYSWAISDFMHRDHLWWFLDGVGDLNHSQQEPYLFHYLSIPENISVQVFFCTHSFYFFNKLD